MTAQQKNRALNHDQYMAEPLPFPSFSSDKAQRMSQELKGEIRHFLDLLEDLFLNPEEAKDPVFLERFSAAVFALHGSADRAEEISDDAISDAVWTINSMLTGPLDIEKASKDITLLEATRHFDKQNPTSSNLSKILLSFLRYPEATALLTEELELTLNSLS